MTTFKRLLLNLLLLTAVATIYTSCEVEDGIDGIDGTVGTDGTLDGIRNGYKARRAWVRRPPLEGVEIMLPRTARDTMLRGN